MAAEEVCNARSFGEHEYMLLLSKTFGLSEKSREYCMRYIVSHVFFRNVSVQAIFDGKSLTNWVTDRLSV